MPLTKEQLLKNRYKAIAEDTTQSFKAGDILDHNDGWRDNVWQAPNGQYIFNPERYPHLFQLLPWWSDRKPEDMPQYYKYSGNHGVFKTNFRPQGGIVMLQFSPTETVPTRLEYTLPATEEEYTAYINQKQQ